MQSDLKELVAADPADVALAAGLEYVNDAIPGISRRRGEDGWVYLSPDGTVITDEGERERIRAIAIPPRWTGVWISPNPRGHIQATGRDGRGRKQYRYHERWREVRDATKFYRMGSFGEALPGLRRRIDADLDLAGLARDKVLAAVIRLMDETLIRIGNEQYARENESFGLTTLRHEHVAIEGASTVRFEFRAKSGKEHRVRLSDPRLAAVVHACHELPCHELSPGSCDRRARGLPACRLRDRLAGRRRRHVPRGAHPHGRPCGWARWPRWEWRRRTGCTRSSRCWAGSPSSN